MTLYTRVAILCFFLLSFTKSFSQQLPKLKINLDQAYGGAFSDYLDSIEYIPLETTEGSLFGDISELIITDSSFVVTDIDTRSILFFSLSGKFIKRISKRGTLLVTVAVHDVHKNKIAIVFQNASRTKKEIGIFSLLGDFIKTSTLKDNEADFYRNSIIIDENNYWLKNPLLEFDPVSNFHFLQYRNNVKVKSVIPMDSLNRYSLHRLIKRISPQNRPMVYSNNFYFSTPLEHKVYKVSTLTGEAEPLFQLVFPASLGINNKLLAISEKKQIDSIVNTKWFTETTVLSLENIFCDDNKIMFKTRTGSFGFYGPDGKVVARNFLYKFQDGRLIAFERVRPDSSTYFLPFSDASLISFEGFHYSKECMYTYISSLQMFSAYQATKEKNPQYPPVLQSYFKTQNRKSNPVIVRMKLKE